MIKYTLKNSNGFTLAYNFSDRLIFNGDNPNAKNKHLLYSVAKESTAKKLLAKAEKFGIQGCSVAQIEVENPEDKIVPIRKKTLEYLDEADETKEVKTIEDISFDDDELFADLNAKCIGCTRACKQSNRAVIIKCPQYSPVNKK